MIHPHDLYDKSEPWTIRIKSLAREFTRRGHRVSLAYFPVDIDRCCEGFWEEDEIKIVPLNRSPGPRTFFINIKKIFKLVEEADIVHFQKCHHYSAIPAVVAAYMKGKPLHYDWDDWETKIWFESNKWLICSHKGYFHTQWLGLFFKILERFLPKLADTVSVSSQRLKELCLTWGIDSKKIYHAPVGADLEKFNPRIDSNYLRTGYNAGNKKVVLYLGQLHGGQYVELFIRAANVVLHKCPEAAFMVVGEGFKLNNLKSLAVNLGIEDKVKFIGAVSHNEVPGYIALADVCVACFEDNDVTCCKSPLKIAEYLASGKAIVASNVGEVRNMIGGAGLLVEPGNYKAIAQGLLRVLSDDSLKFEMGRRARKRAEAKYNWGKTAENLLKAYSYVLTNCNADNIS